MDRHGRRHSPAEYRSAELLPGQRPDRFLTQLSAAHLRHRVRAANKPCQHGLPAADAGRWPCRVAQCDSDAGYRSTLPGRGFAFRGQYSKLGLLGHGFRRQPYSRHDDDGDGRGGGVDVSPGDHGGMSTVGRSEHVSDLPHGGRKLAGFDCQRSGSAFLNQ